MRCFIVAVNYPVLKETVAYNRHHFESVYVITSELDIATHNICRELCIPFYTTDAFYRHGAHFNKWLALEEGLDFFGRDGWLWIMDADIFLPNKINFYFRPGNLYTPHRRMVNCFVDEAHWNVQREAANKIDFNGYCHIFHSSDPNLPTLPWYQTNWTHAGGADTFFQLNWPQLNKIRPNFEVLHVGPPGTNWCGVGKHGILHKLRSVKTPGYVHERIQLPNESNND